MDTGEDQRISKEEFTDDSVKKTIETVSFFLPKDQPEQLYPIFQWVGPVEDMSAEFDRIDRCFDNE